MIAYPHHAGHGVRLLLALLLLGGPGCGSAPDDRQEVRSLVITAPTGDVSLQTLGRTIQFAAEARGAAGELVVDLPIQWHSSVPGAITAAGLFTALQPGDIAVYASAGGAVSEPRTVTIAPLAVGVTVTPDSLVFGSVGSTQPLVIAAVDSSGAPVTEGITWLVADTGVARPRGVSAVMATGVGTTRVIAAAGTAADTVPVHVTQVPASITAPSLNFTTHAARQVTPAVLDSGRHVIPGYPVELASDDSTILGVTPGGLLAPGAEGQTQLRMRAGPVMAAAPALVRYVMASAQIVPGHMLFRTAGRPQHAELYAVDSLGVIIGRLPDSAAGRPGVVQWTAFGWYFSIQPSGTGVDVYPEYQYDYEMLGGTFNSGFIGYSLISVWWYPATFGLTADRTTLAVGDTAIFTAVALDSAGNDLFQRAPFFWLSTDQTVAWVVSDIGVHEGRVIGLAPGTSWIHMFGAGREDSVLVTVQ